MAIAAGVRPPARPRLAGRRPRPRSPTATCRSTRCSCRLPRGERRRRPDRAPAAGSTTRATSSRSCCCSRRTTDRDDRRPRARRACPAPSASSSCPTASRETKPKACNVGLFFARGEFLVIYDAEDRPERRPAARGRGRVPRRGADDLVCVQARLNYFNARENVLTRMFTLEYSHWFDYMLPGPRPRCGCRSRSAARRTTSAPTRCASSAAGTRTTSPRTPTSACAPRPRATRVGDHRLDDLRGGLLGAVAVGPPAHPLDQGLHADGARPHAPSRSGSCARPGCAARWPLVLLIAGTPLDVPRRAGPVALPGLALLVRRPRPAALVTGLARRDASPRSASSSATAS